MKMTTTAATMSSVELVDLINSMREEGKAELAHSDFLKKVEKVLGKDAGKFSSVYMGGNGQERPCYRLPKRECELMAMSESYAVQAKVYDRMTELEQQSAQQLNPANFSRMQLIEIAMQAEQERLVLEAKVAEQAPKVEMLDRIATADGSFCIRDAAKNLQVQEKKLKQLLIENHWIYRRPMGTGLLAYSDKLQAGLMEHKLTNGQKSDGSEWTSSQARITPKGMVKLAQILNESAPLLSVMAINGAHIPHDGIMQ